MARDFSRIGHVERCEAIPAKAKNASEMSKKWTDGQNSDTGVSGLIPPATGKPHCLPPPLVHDRAPENPG